MPRFINPVPQLNDGAGNPLVEGNLYFFKTGTNDPLTTYADANETIPNTHPVKLTGAGRTPNIFFSEPAKVLLTDSNDVQIWERDPVINQGGLSNPDWNAVTIYDEGDVVNLNGILYVSIAGSNQNNIPTSNPAFWTEYDLLKRWNINETYELGDPVTHNDKIYFSKVASNLGNDPSVNSPNWTLNFSGAAVFLGVGATQSLPQDTLTALNFTAEIYDTDGFHDNATNNTRLTVINDGKVIVRAAVFFTASTAGTGERTMIVRRNNLATNTQISVITSLDPSSSQEASLNASSHVIDVLAGDYFELLALRNSNTTTFAFSDNALGPLTVFSIEVVE